MDVTLLQFLYSPYNEKVRWALDWKGVPHRRQTLLPGPHRGVVKRATGQTGTPVLRLGNETLWGSARILQALERRFPEPALFPADPGGRTRALLLEKQFDDHLVPRMRRAVLDAMLQDLSHFARTFGAAASPAQRALYRAVLPLARPLVRKGNGIVDQASVADGHAAIAEALDFVARETAATGYLVGGGCTVADVVAGSALAMIANPDHPDVRRPQPLSAPVRALLARSAAHPGVAWTQRVYREHRLRPAA